MELVSKKQMIGYEWRSFEHYPKNGSDIMLHVKGRSRLENKVFHDFVRIRNFNCVSFNPRRYNPPKIGVAWGYSWLPVTNLIADDD